MPKKSTATSVMGYAVTPLARRTEAGVRQSDTPATATIAISRHGACRNATASTTSASPSALSPPRTRSGSISARSRRSAASGSWTYRRVSQRK